MNRNEGLQEMFGEVVFAYTREQAIFDGVLIDVSKMAKEAGIRFPVAVTHAVWNEYIVPNKKLKEYGQSIDGRLWDLLWMFRYAAQQTKGDLVQIQLYFLVDDEQVPTQQLVTLKGVCGPGDHGEAVITIMMPHED